ncbi:MAG: hypothetical protein J7494_12250 [Sphingobium sp.]|nr:hypothetical protein [Sphingobium sp.]
MRKSLVPALALLVLASPAAAQQAVPVPVENDLRCIAVLSALTGNLAEGEQRAQMAAAVMYFLGHFDGQGTKLDLKAELKRIVPGLTAQQMGDEAKRCAAILIEKGTQLQDVGKELSGAK